jgi:DNA-binding MarR family transcriptional regulator
MYRETIRFSLQLAAVFLGHRRSLSHFFNENYRLTYSEATLLLALREVDAPVLLTPLADYLIFAKKTVLVILVSLESKQLITKENYSADKRLMSIRLTERGKDVASQTQKGLDKLVRSVFMATLPEQDFEKFMSNSIKAGVDDLRAHPAAEVFAANSTSSVIGVDFLIYWRVLYDRWEKIACAESKLSFSSFRVLALLDESDNLSSCDIADYLLIQRSGITVCKNQLLANGLIRVKRDVSDRRRQSFAITAKGRKLVRSVDAKLNEITRVAHSHISDDGTAVLNAWYYRMNSNLQSMLH